MEHTIKEYIVGGVQALVVIAGFFVLLTLAIVSFS
jgi:hypothetical protein